MTWYVAAFGYAVLTSVHLVVIKKITKRFQDVLLFMLVNSLFSIPLVAILMLLTSDGWPKVKVAFWLYALLTAAIQYVGLRFEAKVIKEVQLTDVVPFGTFKPLLVGIFAMMFLGQHLKLLGVVGILCIGVGTYALEIRQGQGLLAPLKQLMNKRRSKGIQLYGLSQLVYAFFPIPLRLALNAVTPFSPYFVALVMLSLMALTAFVECLRVPGLFRKNIRKTAIGTKELFGLFCLSASIVAAQQFTELTAYAHGNVAAVSAIFKLEIVLVMLWGWIIFHESRAKERLAGGAVMVVGAIFLGF